LEVVANLPELKDFKACQTMLSVRAGSGETVSAIRSNEEIKSLAPWLNSFVFDSQDKCDAVLQEHAKLIFYGVIRYRDVFEEFFETAFLWEYKPPATLGIMGMTPLLNRGIFIRGAEPYNYRT
jgi:hypothetical protein